MKNTNKNDRFASKRFYRNDNNFTPKPFRAFKGEAFEEMKKRIELEK